MTLAGTDLEHRLLPNVIAGPSAVVGIGLSVPRNPGRWWVYVVSAVAVAAGLFALALAYPGGMGMGTSRWGDARGVFGSVRGFGGVLWGVLWGARRGARRWGVDGCGQDPAR